MQPDSVGLPYRPLPLAPPPVCGILIQRDREKGYGRRVSYLCLVGFHDLFLRQRCVVLLTSPNQNRRNFCHT